MGAKAAASASDSERPEPSSSDVDTESSESKCDETAATRPNWLKPGDSPRSLPLEEEAEEEEEEEGVEAEEWWEEEALLSDVEPSSGVTTGCGSCAARIFAAFRSW